MSRLVRDALQNESIIHYFGDTTLEFPSTHIYVDDYFRSENPFTPMIPSETENDFFKLCNVFGPPSKFERWCCTIFKTSNLNTEYQNLVGNSLTFWGSDIANLANGKIMRGHRIIPRLVLRSMQCQSLSGMTAMYGYISSTKAFASMMHTDGDINVWGAGAAPITLTGLQC